MLDYRPTSSIAALLEQREPYLFQCEAHTRIVYCISASSAQIHIKERECVCVHYLFHTSNIYHFRLPISYTAHKIGEHYIKWSTARTDCIPTSKSHSSKQISVQIMQEQPSQWKYAYISNQMGGRRESNNTKTTWVPTSPSCCLTHSLLNNLCTPTPIRNHPPTHPPTQTPTHMLHNK